jgi:sortase (surface protein transpeptidase)
MEIPDSFHQAGWYKYGPAPGAPEGNAVIAGHVDSLTEVMPLAELEDVQPGAVVTVGRHEADPLRYRVTEVRHVPKATLDGQSVFRRDGPHQLKIITCGGDWLPEVGDYEDNVVLTAVPL